MGFAFTKLTKAFASSLCLAVLLQGCATHPAQMETLSSIKTDPAVPLAKNVYHIGPGDELEVKFFFAPELNDRMTVRPDGKISIMFAQDIQAAGLTADQLASDIRAVLAPHVKQLDLVVIIRNFASQRVFVAGEVFKPGPVALAGNETIMQALTTAGWVTPTAGTDKVVVVRRDERGEEKAYPVNVTELQNGINMAQNINVQAGDLILVPPSNVASADRWVEQNIRMLLPFTPSAGISYNINRTPTQ